MFSRLQRRQAQFFQEASWGLLALVRLATQDDGDDEGEEETSIESLQGMEGGNIVPPEQVRAAIVENIVQLAQVVRGTCDAVEVSILMQRCLKWAISLLVTFYPVPYSSNLYSLRLSFFASIASVLSMLNVWETCRLKNIVAISNEDWGSLYFRLWWVLVAHFGLVLGMGKRWPIEYSIDLLVSSLILY